MRGISVRHTLTDEWADRGARQSKDFAILTNDIMQGAFELKVHEYKEVKGLKKENLRDHMTDLELIITMHRVRFRYTYVAYNGSFNKN